MLRKHSHLATSAFMEDNRLFTEFKGALTENFVLQSMLRQFEVMPRYWANAPYEVDFVIQRENDVIPVEANAGTNVKATSIKNIDGNWYYRKKKNGGISQADQRENRRFFSVFKFVKSVDKATTPCIVKVSSYTRIRLIRHF